jgi:HEPN domain-containing protein
MPPERREPGSASDWLRHAESDLELSRMERPPKVLLEDLCFHTQQAAEKALKAVLVSHEIPFPKTHNIRTLLDLLPLDVTPPSDVRNAASLTDYAVVSRYPGDLEPVTEAEHQEAIHLAESVVHWAENLITPGNNS